jgi:hypothetical protein
MQLRNLPCLSTVLGEAEVASQKAGHRRVGLYMRMGRKYLPLIDTLLAHILCSLLGSV